MPTGNDSDVDWNRIILGETGTEPARNSNRAELELLRHYAQRRQQARANESITWTTGIPTGTPDSVSAYSGTLTIGEELNEPIRFRKYVAIPELVDRPKKGRIVKSIRPFGVELEVQIDSLKGPSLVKSLPPFVGVGHDGSIRGYGVELQTPPASGEQAEKMIRIVCHRLHASEAKTDKSCGYHIHLDTHDLDNLRNNDQAYAIKNLWAFYIVFEDVLLSFMPISRRFNQYCRHLGSDYHIDEIFRCNTVEELERVWYRAKTSNHLAQCKSEAKHGTRYRGANFHTLFREKHLEIRFHSGTVNHRKILEWANLHCQVVDKAIETGLWPAYDPHTLAGEINLDRKTEIFFDMLGLSPESEAYFRVRQDKFKIKITKKEMPKEATKVAEELLVTEIEN